ncbi:MAG: HEAT repeat domain-containing protein [Candidatus Bathyarchaeia archaeon]
MNPQINIDDLIRDAKEDSWRQLEAIRSLGETNNPKAVDELINLLKVMPIKYNDQYEKIEKAYNVRWTAAKSLAKLNQYSIKALIDHLTSIENKKDSSKEEQIVITEILWILGEIRDESLLDVLNKYMRLRINP